MSRAVLLLVEQIHQSQLEILIDYCRARGHEIVGTAPAILAALRMVDAGEADVIVAPPDRPLTAEPGIEVAAADGTRRPRLI